MTYKLLIPVAFILVWLGFVFYIAYTKRSLKGYLATVVYPGLFFIAVWAILYYMLLS